MTEHINEERLGELAGDPVDVQSEEDQHISDCERCMKIFVKLVKSQMTRGMFN